MRRFQTEDIRQAKVFVTSAYSDKEPITSFLEIASRDKFKQHCLVSDPDEADFILFIENSRYHDDYFFSSLLKHELVLKYPDKTFMYNPHDQPWFILPGLYACMPKWLKDDNIAATPYMETINPFIHNNDYREPKYLFSFDGRINSSARRKIFQITDPRAKLIETSTNIYGNQSVQTKQDYARLLLDSKFVLAPKGAGTSSYRLFEAMKAGRVPVIISDNWLRPPGLAWESFAIFVAEKDILRLPEILRNEEINWRRKGRIARENWERFFADDTKFHYFINTIIKINSKKNKTSLSFRIRNKVAFFRFCFRRLVIQEVKHRFFTLKNSVVSIEN
jgi:hypothetical protein